MNEGQVIVMCLSPLGPIKMDVCLPFPIIPWRTLYLCKGCFSCV